jgi:hypothetical protein
MRIGFDARRRRALPVAALLAAALAGLLAIPAAATTVPDRSVEPEHSLRLGIPKLDRRAGTATLPATVDVRGWLRLSGRRVRTSVVTATGPGSFRLDVVAMGKAGRKLSRKGWARVNVLVDFHPADGSHMIVETKTVKLELVRARSGRA